jgi:pimeloyl-ACP methyl ester carboxylesterase
MMQHPTHETVALHAHVHGKPTHPDLVILHGLFGSAANWRSIVRKLSDTFHVYSLFRPSVLLL